MDARLLYNLTPTSSIVFSTRKPGGGSVHKLLVIVGPTAVGKTDIAIQLALKLNGEIISADSMQIYRGMDIGTAKPTLEEQAGIPHHLIDVVDPGEPFSVADFQALARAKIDEISARGRLPILAGGTGLYVRAVIDPYNFIPAETDWKLREKLRRQAQEVGLASIYQWLSEVDPVAADRIHPNDARRIIRALEVYQTTGKPLSFWEQQVDTDRPLYDLLMIGLNRPRQELYQRINLRVDKMVEAGLLDEARRLLAQGLDEKFIANQAIGYKEFFPYLKGQETLDEAMERLKQNTRRYAKRQLTWFRADPRIQWVQITVGRQTAEIVNDILQIVAAKWQIV
ncbi:MAG: tRNA (adenosine(37)-N6)-dimethylallyltransferase MiaA [Firmicutes bacterium]|nr:tRNA (adenosine(37)-N6)-dimethylallyltransferase MiaA [Bacillota bacterium]